MSEKVDTSRGNIDFVQNAIRGAWHEMEELPLQTAELLVALMDERENLNDQMDEHLKQWGMCVEENKRILAANESLAKDAERLRQHLAAERFDNKCWEYAAMKCSSKFHTEGYVNAVRHSVEAHQFAKAALAASAIAKESEK